MTTTENSKIINTIENGNCTIEIYDDGTKIRRWPNGEEPNPEYPESIDVKITDYCEMACSWCHESSTKKGEHAKFESIAIALRNLPKGIEIAIGGGNPLSHPEIEKILLLFHHRGFISNITMNAGHIQQFKQEIINFRNKGLIRGLGISFRALDQSSAEEICDNNTIYHLIAGVHNIEDAMRLVKEKRKILILGYKEFGFGINFMKAKSNKVINCLNRWKYWIGTLMKQPNAIVSFDNLAIVQLNIKDWITPEAWEKYYMGDDGLFSMYIDTVKMEYAKSSTSPRTSIVKKYDYNYSRILYVGQMFQNIRGIK